jgi:hypothetical protein
MVRNGVAMKTNEAVLRELLKRIEERTSWGKTQLKELILEILVEQVEGRKSSETESP